MSRRMPSATWSFACLFAVGMAGISQAADRIWDGGGANNNWSTSANWDGDLTAPVSNDSLTFDGAVRLTPNNDLTADSTFGPITFAAGAGAFVISGNSITLGGDIADNSPNNQAISLPLILNGARSVAVTDGGSLALNGVISSPADGAFGITKTGNGTLTLGAANTYAGATVLDGGRLVYAVDNAAVKGIAFGATPTAATVSATMSALDLTNASVATTGLIAQTTNVAPEANTITIGAGKTLTVNGQFTVGVSPVYTNLFAGVRTALNVSGDRLAVNSGAELFRVGVARANTGAGGDPTAFLDLTALSHFTHQGTNHFRVGNGNSRAEMLLANTSNTITAAQIRVGDSGQDAGGTGGADNNNAGRSLLRLGGGTNVFNADTIIIGRTKSGGTIDFQGATGTLVIAGSAGGASKANIQVGSSDNATGSGDESMLPLAGHSVTVQGGNVVIGQLAGGGGGNSARGNVTFDTGTFSADSLRLGVNSAGAATNGATGVLTLGGESPGLGATGVLNVNNLFYLAHRTNTTAASGRSSGTFTINGGTANINADILDASTTVSTAGPNVSTLTLADGTLNLMGHSIGSASAPLTTVSLVGGTLNNAALISGKSITLGAGLTLVGDPSYVIGNSELTGTLDASGRGTLTLASGRFLQGGGTVLGDVVAASGSRINIGTDLTADTLTFSQNLTLNNNSTVRFKLSENTVGNDQATILGNLTAAGTVNLELDALAMGPQAANTYTLFNYSGTLTGNQTNFAVTGPLSQSRLTFSVVPTATTPGVINLLVGGSGAATLTWIGNLNNRWDLVGAANWQGVALSPQQFFTLDNVIFDDISTNMSDVELVGQLRPGSVTINAARNYTFAGTGEIVGGGMLTKSGTGTLVVANANAYTGATSVNGGTLQVGNGGTRGTLGTGLVTNDAVLVFNRSDAYTVPNVIGGGGELRHNGTGTLTLSGVNTYLGPTNITAGTIKVTDESSLGDVAGGVVTVASGAALDLAGGTAANGIDFGVKQFRIVGTGVGGTGVLTNSGTVAQQNAFEQVVLTGNATVGGTGRFDIRGDTSALDLGNFTLTKVGSNQFTLVGTSVTDGNIVVNQGVFAIETTTSLSNALGQTGTITYNAGTTAQFFNLTGDVTRPMILNGGVTMGNASAGNQPSTVGSNITLNGDVTITNLNNSAGALTLNGVISETGGPRSVTKNGPTTLTLSGANTYTGTTTINDGILRVTGSINNNNAVSVAAPATFAVEGTATVGAVSGGGTVTVGDGTNAATLTAGHLRQITVSIAAGSKAVMNSNGGPTGTSNLNPPMIAGDIGAWTSTYDLTNNDAVFQSSAATKAADFARVYDQLKSGFAGGVWTGTGITSSTAATNPTADTGLSLVDNALLGATDFSGQTVNNDSLLLKYTYYGDIDLNGRVDGDDLTTFALNFGRTSGATQVDGDIDFNGRVDGEDLTVFANNFNKGIGNPLAAGAVAAVPEPASLVLAGLGAGAVLCGLAVRRRR